MIYKRSALCFRVSLGTKGSFLDLSTTKLTSHSSYLEYQSVFHIEISLSFSFLEIQAFQKCSLRL